MSIEEQWLSLYKAQQSCEHKMHTKKYPVEGTYCNRTWDDIICWMEARAGTIARQKCPDYINGFNTEAYAERICLSNGSWYYHPESNSTWTNYSACGACMQTECRKTDDDDDMEFDQHVPTDFAERMDKLRLMYNIGYGISLTSLLVAVAIMLACRRLRSRSNLLHMNLFIAFILRAGISFLKENILVQGLGFEYDVRRKSNGGLEFIEGSAHWECKLFFTAFHYAIGACHMWIFTEGIYLHTLVYKTLWTERHGIKLYVLFGWASPLLFVLPWVIVRALYEDIFCWNTHPTAGYYWIMKAAIVTSILVNFGFFVNIVRVLVVKVRASNRQHEQKYRYRKLAKFILVLIPLFGVIYIVFLALPENWGAINLSVTFLYCEMFVNSTQGFVLALLFCFLNEEVHLELRRVWSRHKMRRKDTAPGTRSWVFSSTQNGARKPGSSLKSRPESEFRSESIPLRNTVTTTPLLGGSSPEGGSREEGVPGISGTSMKESQRRLLPGGNSSSKDIGKKQVYSFSKRYPGNMYDAGSASACMSPCVGQVRLHI